MAIAHGSSTDGGNNGGSTTNLTFSHNCGAGTDRILFVHFNGDSAPGNDDVTGVTYNGVACTLAQKYGPDAADRWLYVYYLINPSSGANNVSITTTNAHNISGGATHYTGGHQASQPDALATNVAASGSDTSLTTSVTVATDQSWIALIEGSYNANNPPGAGTGATRRVFGATFGEWGWFDGNAAESVGSQSMQTTRTSSPSHAIAHNMLSFKPSVAAAGTATRPERFRLTRRRRMPRRRAA